MTAIDEDYLISTLEMSLRQFKTAQTRLQERLKQVENKIKTYEDEADQLKTEIDALQESGRKTEEALDTLTRRSLKI